MIGISLLGIRRPALPDLLAVRGIATAARAPILFAAAGLCPPGATVVIEANDVEGASAALDAGAADAVTCDDPDALVAARLATVIRRRDAATLTLGDLVIDPVARRVMRSGRDLALLPREYALLLQFARAVGTTVGRPALRRAVWGRDFDPGTNVIEVHVSRLRAKLHRGFAAPVLLTDKGEGYRLVPVPIAPDIGAL